MESGVREGEDTSWLAKLAVEDLVIRHPSNGGERIVLVARVLPTQIVIRDGKTQIRYRRKDGWQIGASVYDGSFLSPYTDEAGERIRLWQAQNRVYDHCRHTIGTRFAALTMEQCAEVIACFRRVELIDADVPRKDTLIDTLMPMPEQGWIAGKLLTDGRMGGVALMTYGKGRLQVGNAYVVDDGW